MFGHPVVYCMHHFSYTTCSAKCMPEQEGKFCSLYLLWRLTVHSHTLIQNLQGGLESVFLFNNFFSNANF